MNKNGELSINLIILIVIGLLILVILAFVIADKFSKEQVASSCIENGGVCKEVGSCENPLLFDSNNNDIKCSNPTYECCPI